MAIDVIKRFYNSKEWITFRNVIILERIKKLKEEIKCEHCGKIITESKFIQVHHIKELTPDNINDTSISLNPSNVEVLCQQCHNKQHNRWCKGSIRNKAKGVYLVYGPPCSGKTSYVLKNMKYGDIVVDMDRLYEAVTLLPRYDKPDNLKYNVLAIRNSILDNLRTRYGNFNTAWIVGGYADKYQREPLLRELGAEPILINATKEDCLYRLKYSNDYRQEHEEQWIEYIEKWFNEYTE